jgi:glucose-1-phosphate thymidylyltransferase
VPKPLIRVAGRPVLDYVIDKLAGLDVEELIFITGHLKEQIESYVRTAYDLPARFVEQEVQDGTAGAVNLARPWVDGPVLIVFVDTVFDADLSVVNSVDADGILWAKEVEDYQRFGVIVTDGEGYMQRIVEKPSEPVSRLANIGLYYVRDWRTLFDGIDVTLAGDQQKGEWFLTDAFQYMIDHGKRLKTVEVTGWYDCGKVETVLSTNLHLLQHGRARVPDLPEDVEVVGPVYIADGARVERSSIGPNVSLDEDVIVRGSTVRDAMVGRGSTIENATVSHSLVGDEAEIRGESLHNMVAAKDEIGEAP